MSLYEPLFDDESNKFVAFERHKLGHKTWKAHRRADWNVDEIDFLQDKIQLASGKLPLQVVETNKVIHAFFLVADGLIGESTLINLYKNIKISDIRKVYAQQISIEAVHAETYRKIAKMLCRGDLKQFEKMCHEAKNRPSIKAKIDLALKVTHESAPRIEQLVGQALVEGLLFPSSFAEITFFKKEGYLQGIGQANDLIQGDETEHWSTGAMIYTQVVNKLTQTRFYELVEAFVAVEKVFVDDCLETDLPGLNSTLMKKYVEFVADRLTRAFGYEPIYNTDNPFDWIVLSSITPKINFFDRKGAEYNIGETYQNTFTTDEDV